MSDAELEIYLGIAGDPNRAKIMAAITPADRAVYEKMLEVERAARDGDPMPAGVIVCREARKG